MVLERALRSVCCSDTAGQNTLSLQPFNMENYIMSLEAALNNLAEAVRAQTELVVANMNQMGAVQAPPVPQTGNISDQSPAEQPKGKRGPKPKAKEAAPAEDNKAVWDALVAAVTELAEKDISLTEATMKELGVERISQLPEDRWNEALDAVTAAVHAPAAAASSSFV